MELLKESLWGLLFLASLTLGDAMEPFCEIQSARMRQQSDMDQPIYGWDMKELSGKKKAAAVNNCKTIELFDTGDESEFDCYFNSKNRTCCHICKEREGTCGERLCGVTKQPYRCRQSEMEEIEKHLVLAALLVAPLVLLVVNNCVIFFLFRRNNKIKEMCQQAQIMLAVRRL